MEYSIKNSLDSNSIENATVETGAGNGHRAHQKFMQHKGLATGDLDGDVERERRGEEKHKTAGETGHIDNCIRRK